MRFLGTQDISLRAEKDALELNIQKAGMSGAEKRDPQSVAAMRQRLSEIYTRLDPAKAVKEQVKANQGTRFNPGLGDYDPLNMNLQTAMAVIDRKYGNQPGYLKARDQVKYSIQNQLSGGTPIDSASIVGRARDELTKATKKDPGGAKSATLESRRNLVDAQKTKASDLEGMTDPFEIAQTLMALQNQGGMDRPIGGGMANRPNISPYGNSLPAQAMAAAGMVTDQMRPSESIPSTQGILGKERGVQVDAFLKSLGSMFDPAQLATPITGAADMADMAFRALDPVARQQVEKELKGATKEEQDTFFARMLGMLTGGVIQGKIGAKLSSRLKSAADLPLPAPLEEVLNNMAANQSPKRNFLPEMKATQPVPDQIGLSQAASMKRPKPSVTPAPKSPSAPAYSIDAPEKLYHGSPSKFSQLKDQPLYFTSEYPGQTRKYSELGGRGSNRQFEPLFVDEQGVVYERQPNNVWAAKWDSGEDGELVPLPESARSSIPDLNLDDVERMQRNWVGGGMAPEAYRYETKGSGKLLNLVREEKPGDPSGYIKGDSQAVKDVIGKLDPQGNSLAQEIINKARKDGYFDWQDTTMLSESWASTRNGRLQTEAWNIISSQLKEKGYSGIRFADDGSVTTALLDKPTFSNRTELRSKVNEPIAKPVDFTVGQEIKVPKKNGSEVAAKVTDVTDVSVGIETAAGVKKFYSPEDAKAILTPDEPVVAKAPDITPATGGPDAPVVTTPEPVVAKTPDVPESQPVALDGGGTSQPDFSVGERVVMPYSGKNGTNVEAVITAVTPDDVTVKIKGGKSVTYPTIVAKSGFRRIISPDTTAPKTTPPAPKATPDVTPNQSAQPSLGMMDEGGGGKAPPPGGTAPGTTPPGQPKRRNPKQPRQAGKADLKTLGVAAGVAGAGAVAIFKGDIDRAIEENDLEGVRNTLIKMGLGTAALSVILQKGRTGLVNATRHSFDPFRYILDPRSLEKIAPDGVFKNALADVLSINDLYKIKTARAMMDLEDAAEGAFGKKRDLKKGQLGMKAKDSPVYKEWNTKFRDHVEQNVANGKKWDDGVPPQFAKFASAAIKTMDKFLDEWEAMGGRIKVVNDGVQQAKIQVGASLKLATGEWAEYQGFSKRKDGKVKLQVEVVNAAGKKVMREIAPGEEFGRPVYRLGEAYVPRIYTRSFINQIIEGKPEFKTALNDSAVKAGGNPLTDAEFVNLQDFARGFAETDSPTKVNSFMASLEKERTLQFAKLEYTDAKGNKIVLDPYENSYFDAVRKSTEKASKRIAVAETLGIDSDVIARVIDGVRGVDYDGANYLTQLVGNLLDLGPKTPNPFSKVARVSAWESRYQAATKLLGGTSAISQFADIVIPLTEFGPVTVGKAIQKLVKDPTFKSDISAFNGGTAAYLKEMSGIENVGSKAEIGASKFVDTGMTVVQMKQMDKTMKRINTASVVTEVERLGTKIEKGKTLTDPETRMLDRLGMTRWQDSIKNVGIKKTMKLEKFQAEIAGHARTFMYSGAVEDMPQWMSTPTGAMVMRFKKPWYVATKTLMQGALNEAAHGNYTPLARGIAYSVGVGAGAQYLKDIVKAGIFDQEAKEMLFAGNFEGALKRMFVDVPSESNYLAQGLRGIRDDKAAGLMQLFGLVAQTIYESGSTGVAGEVLPLKQRGQVENRQYNYWERFEPISSQSARRYIFGIGGDIVGAVSGTMTPEKAGANIYETVRSEVIPARRVFDALSYKPDEVKRREGERKIKRENATVDKNMPEKMRREQQQYKAFGEKIQRKIINEATPKF